MSTPALLQYLEIKQQHPECVLFYQVGDFYELFFDDAIKVSNALNIVLTKRGQHEGKDIPMCGVPFDSSDHYINKLVSMGHKIALCIQSETVEEAKKRGYKSVIKRKIIRIITPGTLIEDNLLDAKSNNYVLSLVKADKELYSLSWADISTQKFYFDSVATNNLADLLLLINPSELVICRDLCKNELSVFNILKSTNAFITPHAASIFDKNRAENTLKSFYGISHIDALGQLSKFEVIAVGSLIEYIISTQSGNLSTFVLPSRYFKNDYMHLDVASIKSLEIFKSTNGEKRGSLLNTIDFTLTAPGARLLKVHLSHPLTNSEKLNSRLDLVEFFIKNYELRYKIRENLSKIYDFERALSRIYLKRNEPKDIIIIKESLKVSSIIECLLSNFDIKHSVALQSIHKLLEDHEELISTLESAIYDHANKKTDLNYIKETFHPRLFQYRQLIDNTEKLLLDLSLSYRQITGVNNIKITSNNLIGYYVEVPASCKLDSTIFIHKQSMANAVRYTTAELKQLESEILSAKDSYCNLELQIFNELCDLVNSKIQSIRTTIEGIAKLDLATSFAEMAHKLSLTRPLIANDGVLSIKKGRHLLVESNSNFIANDLSLNRHERVCLLTGPNMAGKSTYLRQNALIIIMAQIGSYVPAEYAHIGIVDKIFTRIGSSDNISAGKSTFMMEMVETAYILNYATDNSFVILDEVGRGTSTQDGVSIAHAIIEHLHNVNQSRTIFATHYHELCQLEKELSALKCYTMKVVEWEHEIVFMHEVIRGYLNKSYGIHVAKLSGIPPSVIQRSLELLEIYSDKNESSHCTETVE